MHSVVLLALLSHPHTNFFSLNPSRLPRRYHVIGVKEGVGLDEGFFLLVGVISKPRLVTFAYLNFFSIIKWGSVNYQISCCILTTAIFAVPVLGLRMPGMADIGFFDPPAKFFGELIFLNL